MHSPAFHRRDEPLSARMKNKTEKRVYTSPIFDRVQSKLTSEQAPTRRSSNEKKPRNIKPRLFRPEMTLKKFPEMNNIKVRSCLSSGAEKRARASKNLALDFSGVKKQEITFENAIIRQKRKEKNIILNLSNITYFYARRKASDSSFGGDEKVILKYSKKEIEFPMNEGQNFVLKLSKLNFLEIIENKSMRNLKFSFKDKKFKNIEAEISICSVDDRQFIEFIKELKSCNVQIILTKKVSQPKPSKIKISSLSKPKECLNSDIGKTRAVKHKQIELAPNSRKRKQGQRVISVAPSDEFQPARRSQRIVEKDSKKNENGVSKFVEGKINPELDEKEVNEHWFTYKRIRITYRDFRRTDDGVYFNDNLILFSLRWGLEKRLKRLWFSEDEVHLFTTFFFQKLREGGHEKVKRWTRKVNIFKKKLLIIPLNQHQHWSVAIVTNLHLIGKKVDYKELDLLPVSNADSEAVLRKGELQAEDMLDSKEEVDSDDNETVHNSETVKSPNKKKFDPLLPRIWVFDSMYGSQSRVVRQIKDYLREEYFVQNEVQEDEREEYCKYFEKPLLMGKTPTVPTQTNSYDCGLFVVFYVEKFLKVFFKTNNYEAITKSWFKRDKVEKYRGSMREKLMELKKELGQEKIEASQNSEEDDQIVEIIPEENKVESFLKSTQPESISQDELSDPDVEENKISQDDIEANDKQLCTEETSECPINFTQCMSEESSKVDSDSLEEHK
eukprot:snap_masked-scaffold_32-processed-gene-0.7-mRNA-1 protein AED:1.00 eAED:1.00 QI:0/0/0/0/1/1/4/0/726